MSNKFYLYLICLGILLIPSISSAQPLADKLKGKILLQVETHGEAWYVNPADSERYYMGRPADAFALMRQLGIGITNANLSKIPIADATSDDKAVNPSFAQKHLGKIFLQIEEHGEAWYVNPSDAHRYFLGRPTDAFNLMRNLGLGIKNSDLDQIINHDNESDDNETDDNNSNNNSSWEDILNNLFNNPNNNTSDDNDTSDDDSNTGDDSADNTTSDTPPAPPVYQTSSKLSTITFHRTIDGYYNESTQAGTRGQDVTLTIAGYLKEIAPTSHSLTRLGDRAYEFSQGKLKWNVSELEEYGDPTKCSYINRTTDVGEDLIANMDVPYDTNDGKDDAGNLVHLPSYDLRLKYDSIGLSGQAELEIVGSLIIPLTETNIITHNTTNLICSGTTSSTTYTKNETGPARFPLTWLNPTLSGHQAGSLTAYETANDLDTSNITTSSAPALFGSTIFVGEITVDNNNTPWTVTWDLEFPI